MIVSVPVMLAGTFSDTSARFTAPAVRLTICEAVLMPPPEDTVSVYVPGGMFAST